MAIMAPACGVKSWRVEAPEKLEGVLQRAPGHDGPALVDVLVQPLEETSAPVRRWMG